jgi:hypothetical protein
MRKFPGAAVAAAVALLMLCSPALAGSAEQTQPAPAAAQSADDDWKWVIYPIYGWLPLYQADAMFENLEDGEPTFPEGTIDGNLEGALLLAFRVDKGRFSLEGGYVYAGLSGEAEAPNFKLGVDAHIADLRAGYEVAPDFFVEAGVRYMAFDVSGTIGDHPEQNWQPEIFEPVVGFTYRPRLSKTWRLVLHGDIGGVITSDSTTAFATAKFEWQPAKHFLLALGGTLMYLRTEGETRNGDVELDQLLVGPVIGIGIPF